MAMGEILEEAVGRGALEDDLYSASSRESEPESVSASDFDCNICLDSVQNPVVTLCGHLYCCACIYKWLRLQSLSTGADDQRHKQCPACKAEISSRTLVPLYGRGQTTIQVEGKNVPRRHIGQVYRFDMPRSQDAGGNMRLSQRIHLSYPQQDGYSRMLTMSRTWSSFSTVLDPLMVMFGEMVSTRLFGTQVRDANYTYRDSYNMGPRMRRQMMQADKSLGRICFFLMCCVIFCLVLF